MRADHSNRQDHVFRRSSTCFTAAVAFIIATLIVVATSTAAPSRYAVIDLGTLGGPYSAGLDLNDMGHVVGNSTTLAGPHHAFRWKDRQMRDLSTLGGPESQAWGVNNLGQVVGVSHIDGTDAFHAFLWQDDGVGMRDLGALSTYGGRGYSWAYDINDAGQIAGSSLNALGQRRAVLWSGSAIFDLGDLRTGDDIGFNEAFAINDFGQVVGYSTDRCGRPRPVRWVNGMIQDLGSLVGDDRCIDDLGQAIRGDGEASGINDFGHVVGSSQTRAGTLHAFLWNDVMHDLGVAAGFVTSDANDINNRGQIVGHSCTVPATVCHATLWENGVPINLNTLIPPDSGWELWFAVGINQAGEIVGYGSYKGVMRAFLLKVQKFVIFVAGLSTTLTPEAILEWELLCPAGDANTFPLLRDTLLGRGFLCSDFLRYSYAGGVVDGTGKWTPTAYDCDQTGQRVATSTDLLRQMIQALASVHPGAEFHLVGHSLGGVLATGILDLITNGTFPPGLVASVTTLDSPLAHASRENFRKLRQRLGPLNLATLFDCGARVFLQSRAADDVADLTDRNRQQVRAVLEQKAASAIAKGVRLLTLGNRQDGLWSPKNCEPDTLWDDDVDTQRIFAARGGLLGLGTGGGTGVSPVLHCLTTSHQMILHDRGAASTAADVIGDQGRPAGM